MAEEDGVVLLGGAPAAAQNGSLDARRRWGGRLTLSPEGGESIYSNEEGTDGFR